MQMERARQLLGETDLPIKTVALKCGFRTEKYFGDAFFRSVGERAGAYRRRLRA
jgi:AraC-like DNA-binding protein